MKKGIFVVAFLVMLTSCLVLMGCSDVITQPEDVIRQPGNANVIPPDLRNTTWTKQISDSETVTLSFGRNTMNMSSNLASSRYDQEWNYRGGSCCGYGYCGFYNGPNSLDFRYTCRNNRLNITGSSMQSLNGNWTIYQTSGDQASRSLQVHRR